VRTLASTAPATAPASPLPGLLLSIAVGVVATLLAQVVPLVGAPVLGILAGLLLSTVVAGRTWLAPGIKLAGKLVLQIAVVLLGAQLSLREVTTIGLQSVPVMLGTLSVCLLLAWLLGRRMGIERDLRTLIGVGTAICGASAIAATSPVIKARASAIAYAISTIFLFNVVAVLTFPPLGHLLGLSQHQFGLFAGTAVNDTSSVVAAATSYGTAAGNYAIVVKLTRSLMIIPICLGLAALVNRRDRDAAPMSVRRVATLVPWFLIGFLIVVAVGSLGLIPAGVRSGTQTTALFLITVALSAIGMSTDVAALRRAGAKPLALGFLLWLSVSAVSLLLQTLV
jgi:uncharacterized integral membrane protein (TIGR00698 family)